MRSRNILERQYIWYGLVPATMAVLYWFGLRSFAFTDGSWFRIPALPKVFFDQTMYLQIMAKDIIHGFYILPLPLRPFVWIASHVWPTVTLSELYVLGVIGSAIASLWMLAVLFRRIGATEKDVARSRALTAFLVVQAILVLRPGGPSWYVPFFLLAFLLVWLGEGEWEARRTRRAITRWVAAIFLSSVYPWYLAVIIATIGLLFLNRFIRSRMVLPLVSVGLILAGLAFLQRDQIATAVTSSYSVLLAVYGGFGWSHLTTWSNTILVIAAWCFAWILASCRVWPHADAITKRSCLVLLAAWVAQVVLWFQSLLTGFSIIPDHFIYTVWLLSAISWSVWPDFTRDRLTTLERRIVGTIGLVGLLYVLSVFARLLNGTYVWTVFPSLLIHVGIWTFLALAMLQNVWRPTRGHVALALGILYTVIGTGSVRASALEHALMDHEMEGVRQWIFRERPSSDIHWCSDAWSSDYLFSVTGQSFHPAFSQMRDPFPITTLQNRLVEVSAYFHAESAEELYIWDDMILHDLDFPCRAFVPAISLLDRLPISRSIKTFVSGCDQAWADDERTRVIAEMERRWSAPLPESSALCDRFVMRKRLQTSWRIPATYGVMYEDDQAAVYGRR